MAGVVAQDPGELEDAVGLIFTCIKCPACSSETFVEGNQNSCEYDCPDCDTRLYVKVED